MLSFGIRLGTKANYKTQAFAPYSTHLQAISTILHHFGCYMLRAPWVSTALMESESNLSKRWFHRYCLEFEPSVYACMFFN